MKTLYLDCSMGAAGDMLCAALLELLPDRDAFVKKLNDLKIPGIEYRLEKAEKCGITGSHMTVLVDGVDEADLGDDSAHHHEHTHENSHEHDHHTHDHDSHHQDVHEHHDGHTHTHSHHTLKDIEHIVCEHLDLPSAVRDDILAVYKLIADAESQVHGKPVSEIHFHEVGTMDAIADITAVCMLFHEIAPDTVISSPIHVGSGFVKCAHGILPVPAPATALILKGIPMYSSDIAGELCTPTGAALLRHFVTRFGDMPLIKVEQIGYGMGHKDFPRANLLRALLGESMAPSAPDNDPGVLVLSCNVDDMTAEEISFAMDRLFEAGAREVFTVPVGMKKSRPGTLIEVILSEDKKAEIVQTLFKHTTTIGIREAHMNRYCMNRTIEKIDTAYGTIRQKRSIGFGVEKTKYEYDDLAKIAAEKNLSLTELRRIIQSETKQ